MIAVTFITHMASIYEVTRMDSSVGYDNPISNTYSVFLET